METKIITPQNEPRPGGFPDRRSKPEPAPAEPKPDKSKEGKKQ